MAINTEGFRVKNGSWKSEASQSVAKQGKQTHSEIVVYNALGQKNAGGPFLIKQDAFPCSECDGKFTGQSISVVFKITANNGSYSADHGLGQVMGAHQFPYYIWYHGGTKTAGTNQAAPAGFPAIPNVANV
ncbi:hypothetical protein [Dyella acidisoli]|uniref:Uncharacterized protein n=1 Tax=Dyella acidisoli TaxID=1867834 RepID=A0ABQ5XHY4_9GAMM|nr:hypothetical protein GCM10007901_01570 [Dyella acidisoli]